MKIESTKSQVNLDEVFDVKLTRGQLEWILVHAATASDTSAKETFEESKKFPHLADLFHDESYLHTPYNTVKDFLISEKKKFEPVTITIESLDELVVMGSMLGSSNLPLAQAAAIAKHLENFGKSWDAHAHDMYDKIKSKIEEVSK